MLNEKEKRILFQEVFAPKRNERVLILFDEPHNSIDDHKAWKERRKMAKDWYDVFKKLGDEIGFSVDLETFPATGMNNKQISDETKNLVKSYNLIVAMTEFSVTSSLVPLCYKKKNRRCASMPGVEIRMEDTSLKADYTLVKKYALCLEKLLLDVVAADIDFSNGDHLHLDLRNRIPLVDTGDCTKPGQMINFPSGETCISPYEAADDEKEEFGLSNSNGMLPVQYGKELARFSIRENMISEVLGAGDKVEKLKVFFKEKACRRNIAELGIGCNPNAVVTGNILEDEKVPGLHIAYGMSSHIGGRISCDMHQDICYPIKAPIEAISLVITHMNGEKTNLIDSEGLRFELLS